MQAFLKGGSLSKNNEEPESQKKQSSSGDNKALEPWVEKYRPKCVDDVAYQEEVVAVLKKSLKDMELPNLLFYGPPGTGKTSTILAISKELFGDMYKARILELNASDERGINVIREKVKTFAQQSASGIRPDGRPCPPFKIVILDEADSMTAAAQAALRRTMEKESRSTRFCLICNYVSRIIEPITSRCAKFRFKPLSNEILEKRLREICEKEGLECDEKAMKAVLETSEGDMRKAITYLQSAGRLKPDEMITAEDICEIAGVVPESIISELMKVCSNNSYEKLEATVQNIIHEGYSATQLLNQIHDAIVESDDLKDNHKSAICERLAVCDKRLMDGADEYLQIMDLATVIMAQVCNA